MLDEEVTRLSEPYQGEVKPEEPGLLRVAGPLGLNLATSVTLGDEIVDDLDKAVHGIGWWKAYPDLDQQTGHHHALDLVGALVDLRDRGLGGSLRRSAACTAL